MMAKISSPIIYLNTALRLSSETHKPASTREKTKIKLAQSNKTMTAKLPP